MVMQPNRLQIDAAPDRENSSRAVAVLRERLTALHDKDGRLPPERELAADLGIGRRALRRALEVLEAEGLIWRRQGKGTFVGNRPSLAGDLARDLAGRTNPVEVFEVRLHVEPTLARYAALRATQQEVQRMRMQNDRIRVASDDDSRELWDEALHRQIAQSAGNALFLGMHEIVDQVRRDEAWRSLRVRARNNTARASYVAQHDAIIDAIAARDPATAAEAMITHIRTLAHNILPVTGTEVTLVDI